MNTTRWDTDLARASGAVRPPGVDPGGPAWLQLPFVRLGSVLALIAAIATLDLLADQAVGANVGFFVFYFAPVALAAWGGHRRDALIVALACSATWYAVEYLELNTVARVWNGCVRFLGFAAIGLSVARISELLVRERELNEELLDRSHQVRQLRGLLPICGSCKSIRNDAGYWERLEHFIESHSEAEFSHGLCPKCVEHFEREPADLER